jgi:multiple sugar transport system ATP-binding protein
VTGLGDDTRVIARLPATVSDPIAGDSSYEFAISNDRVRFFDAGSGERTDPVRLGSGHG